MRGSTVDTCTHVSPEGLGTMTIVFYLKVGLGSEVDSPGNRDILRAHRFWQLVVRCLFRLRNAGKCVSIGR